MVEGILALFIQVSRQQRNKANDRLNGLGLHAGQEVVLMRLAASEGITISELSKQVTIQVPTLTRMVDRLTKKGFVNRVKDDQDHRLVRLYLTPQGKSVLTSIERIWSEVEQTVTSRLTAQEQQELIRLLRKIDQ